MTSTLQSTYFAVAGTATFTAAFSEFAPDPFAMSLTSDVAYPEPAIDAAVAADALLRITGDLKNAPGTHRFFAAGPEPGGRSDPDIAIPPPAEENIATPVRTRSADEQIADLITSELKKVPAPATIEELAQRTGFTSEKRLLRLCCTYGIELPAAFHESTSKMDGVRRNKLATMAAAGRTLDEIGGSLEIVRERARQILLREGLNAPRKARRRELKLAREEHGAKLHAEHQSFVDFLRRLEEVRKPESPWIEVQVWKYRLKHRNKAGLHSISNKKLLKLFEAYALALIKRKRISVGKLGKIAGIYPTQVARILKDVGLGSMYWNFDRHITPKWKKEAIVRAYASSPLSVRDIAYFLELPHYVVDQLLRRRGYRTTVKAPILKRGWGTKSLIYRLASEVYEAQDLGFTPEETSYVLDLPLERVRYTQYRRHQFGPVIIRALRDMYPEEGINTPYRWKEKT